LFFWNAYSTRQGKMFYKNMIKVDQEKCKGCGVCEAMCPNIFKLDENGKSQVISQEIEGCGCSMQDIINSCPEGAIGQE
jgi:ferredoxin